VDPDRGTEPSPSISPSTPNQVNLSLNAQSDRSPPYDSFPLLPICDAVTTLTMKCDCRSVSIDDGRLWFFRLAGFIISMYNFFLVVKRNGRLWFWLVKKSNGYGEIWGHHSDWWHGVGKKNFQTVSNEMLWTVFNKPSIKFSKNNIYRRFHLKPYGNENFQTI
jgi:hypothetical protein